MERIGPRSTRIRTFESIHLIVPNSAFLEKTVINLTLSDDLVRGMVEVGVAYGSDTREVEKLLRRVHGASTRSCSRSRSPVVLLHDFGDSALVFRADVLDPRRAPAGPGRERRALPHRLELFREAGIVMAFPQRDVHLDAAAALPVRIVSGGAEGSG